jgi:cellulase/cellobiase CelA1
MSSRKSAVSRQPAHPSAVRPSARPDRVTAEGRPPRRRLSAALVATAALVTALLVGSVVEPAAAASTDVRTATAAQLYGAGQYRSPTSEAAKAATALQATDPAGARAAATIARYPVATWLGEWSTGTTLTRTIDTATAGAAASGTTAVFVVYAIPDRDCGGYSAGGFDERTYDAWIDQVVARTAGTRSAVVVEPDSLAMLSNSACTDSLDVQRYRILSRTVAAFTAAGVPAYLDGGNSNWVAPATMASRLRSAGVAQARGFSTNVANYYGAAQEQAYAQRVSALTGGAHYVIDTSRNGQGWRGTWCNAPGAGLGTSPRVGADGSALDALLWVKTPGASDGTCNGGPAAGRWYSAYAQALVAHAALGAAPTAAALGTVDAVTGGSGTVRVTGWAADPARPDATLTVRVTVDGAAAGTGPASRPRQDVADTYGVGAAHGYDVTVGAAAGVREVCVSVTTVAGTASRLGCESVRVTGNGPVIALERATVSAGGISVSGYAVDVDAPTTALRTTLLVDGTAVRTTVADVVRTDVPALTGLGTRHGFAAVVPAGAGKHVVCARTTGVAGGAEVTAPCRSVTVAASAPRAAVDSVGSPSHRRIAVRGWAFDREDTGRPVTLVVSVSGRAPVRVAAAATRDDIDRSYGVGRAHGFSAVVPAVSGRRSVCVRAVGLGAGGDRSLGCRSVRVR